MPPPYAGDVPARRGLRSYCLGLRLHCLEPRANLRLGYFEGSASPSRAHYAGLACLGISGCASAFVVSGGLGCRLYYEQVWQLTPLVQWTRRSRVSSILAVMGGAPRTSIRRGGDGMFKWLKSRKAGKGIPDTWPRYAMGRAICRWTHPGGKQRVYLIARQDGMFCFGSTFFSDAEFENCWIPEGTGGSFFDSRETAIREIHSGWAWSRTAPPEERPRE